ncbi:MAG TPA: YceI family protein [Longimicrobium sp.]|nr:YceI family protein [Longimicrobium sp.]
MRRMIQVGGLVGAVATLVAMALPSPTLQFAPGSRVWLEGTSTVRSYRCETTQVQGSAALNGESTELAEVSKGVRAAQVTLPVASLDCRNGTMNGHMRRALKAEQNPSIRFRVTSVSVTPSSVAAGAVRMSGPLTIAGQDQAISLNAQISREAGGNIRLKGSKQLNMTQFGVQPPRLMMGTMRVHDNVTVNFDVVLRP